MILDRVPRYFRPLIGLAAILIVIWEFKIEFYYYNYIMYFLPILIAIPLIIRFNKIKNIKKVRGSYDAIELEINGSKEEKEETGKVISSIIKDRSKSNAVKYGSISISSGGYTRTFVAIGSKNKNDVEIEREVFKTLISTSFKNVRIKEINDEEKGGLIKAIDNISPIGKGEILIAPSDKGISLSEGIYIGKTFDNAYNKDVYLNENDIESHIAIFGSTGTGKSTTAATLAYRASGIFDVLIMDWTGEFSDMMESANIIYPMEFNIDPFKIDEFNERRDILIDSLSSGLGLTEPQQYLLMKVIQDENPLSIGDLIEKIERYSEEARWDRDVKRGLLRKIEILKNVMRKSNIKQNLSLNKGINILKLDEIDSLNARKSYALLFLAMIYLKRKRNDKKLLIIIDEAQNYFDSEGGSLIEQMMAQSRKYGLSIVISTQSPSLIPNSVLLNANTKIIHALRSAKDKEVIYMTMSLNHELNSQLDKFEIGEALLQSSSIPNPIIIKVDPINERRNKINKTFINKPIDFDSKIERRNFIKDNA
ncbi:ATP-binding protein [Caldisphaera sp.]|uniref:ATP-binding protein n=1 Tax=Caldisphaera sp. TaxID=2060322 RepID=UPI00345C1AAE